MAKNLVLVESPSKAKTINKYLGKTYKVEATVGHIRNLPKTKLGVDIENNFEPQLLNMRGKGDLIKKIKSLASKSDRIFIATDPDREGEAIAQDIIDILNQKDQENIFRVLFHEITKDSVKSSMKNPLHVNTNLVVSQRARRVMDRIIGYKLSPFLWRAMIEESSNSLSAGRVQSVALRLICEREEAIEKFKAIEYWSLEGNFLTDKKETIEARLYEVNGKTIKIPPKAEMNEDEWKEFFEGNFAVRNAEEAEELVKEISSKKNFAISDVSKKEMKRNPYPPFITSTMQSEASKSIGFRPRKTMQVAQSLYEGVELGDAGFSGLITYMRTDSTRLNADICVSAQSFIGEKFGKDYVPEGPRVYGKKNKKNVQDAHEAIRPTSVEFTPEFVKPFLNKDQMKLYQLVWNRFIASQMESAKLETTTVNISADEYTFRATGTAVKFPGFLALYDETKEDNGNGDENGSKNIPLGLEKDQKMDLDELVKNQHFTKPPARFSESTLIKELESNGIGRPSTYASIVSTLFDRNYVDQENRRLYPTGLGRKVNVWLVENFSGVVNVNFTAQMEDELDQIAEGENNYEKVLTSFYEPFAHALNTVEENIEPIKCEKCGSDMEIKIGRFGKFLACTNYPDCKNIKSLKEIAQDGNSEPEFTGETCPKCGGKTVYRQGRFGKFIGCEKYPDCDFTKQIDIGMKCPKCGEGDVVVKRTKRGRTFYGCSKYPDCDYASWTMPKKEEEQQEEN